MSTMMMSSCSTLASNLLLNEFQREPPCTSMHFLCMHCGEATVHHRIERPQTPELLPLLLIILVQRQDGGKLINKSRQNTEQ